MSNSDKKTGTKLGKVGAVTLQDVANELGVSKSTVSLAINGNTLVAAKTRAAVIGKAQELGYVYNRGAASLSTGETRTVGLAIHDITNSYFSNVCAAIETVLTQNKRLAFLCSTGDSLQQQQRFISALNEYNADGLILCPADGTGYEHLEPILRRHRTVVLMARHIDVEGVQLDYVGNDDVQALYIATKHLIDLGHQRIAMAGGAQNTSAAKQRREGFRLAMQEADLPIQNDYLIDCKGNYEGGIQACKQLLALNTPPTAIACFADTIAMGVLSSAIQHGLQPGKDIAIIGCDGIAEGALAVANLSTVNVQKTAIGTIAAELFLKRLAEPEQDPQRILLPPALVVRGSCGAAQ